MSLHVFSSVSKSLKRVMSGVLIARLPNAPAWSIFDRDTRERNARTHRIDLGDQSWN